MDAVDNLMRTGVVVHCHDCAADTVFVAPDVADPGPGELACTACGAALLVDLVDSTGGERVLRADAG